MRIRTMREVITKRDKRGEVLESKRYSGMRGVYPFAEHCSVESLAALERVKIRASKRVPVIEEVVLSD